MKVDRPHPKFDFNQLVRVPSHVHQSGLATIVGDEWNRNDCGKWRYYIKFDGVYGWWEATEEELVSWQESEGN